MNKRYYEHTLPIIRGSLSNTYGKTRFFDPQTGKDDASNYIQSMKAGRVGVIRIDNKLVNPKIMGLFITK